MKAFFVQGLYYFLSALWPLVHMSSFIAVTGPKTDLWLVKMVALLTMVIGAFLMWSALIRRLSAEILFFAVFSALSYISIDFYYSITRVISPIYLADGGLQLALLYWLIASKFKQNRSSSLQSEEHVSSTQVKDLEPSKTQTVETN
jgi:hypothetical protein